MDNFYQVMVKSTYTGHACHKPLSYCISIEPFADLLSFYINIPGHFNSVLVFHNS